MNSLGGRIAFYRKKAKLTQEQLAEKCSVTPQAVSKWENDLTAPDISLIVPLSELFGITCDELLGVYRENAEESEQKNFEISKACLKIKIKSADGDKVNLNLPLQAADNFLNSGIISFDDGRDVFKGIDVEKIIALARNGVSGQVANVQSNEGDTVEIWLE